MTNTLRVLGLVLLLITPACSGADDGVGTDAGVRLDAGPIEEDGGPDPEPTPIRSVVRVPLLEGLDVHDRIAGPHFDFSTYSWNVVPNQASTSSPLVHLGHQPTAPAGSSVLEMLGRSATGQGASVFGMAYLQSDVPLRVSIWIGRRWSDPALGVTDVIGSVYALAPELAPGPSTFALAPTEEEPVVHGDIAWREYVGTLPTGLLGWGWIAVSYEGDGSLYLNGASVLPSNASDPVPSAGRPGVIGGTLPTERRAPH